MELLIIRHALAFEPDRRRWPDDAARPLSPAGKRRARKAAAGLGQFSGPPDRVLTSPLVRARQTALILTDIAGWPRAEDMPELAPGMPVAAIFRLLRLDRSRRVALVGHQPGLGALMTSCLIAEGGNLPIELKKSAVACLSFSGSARAGHAVLKWLAAPRMLRGLKHD